MGGLVCGEGWVGVCALREMYANASGVRTGCAWKYARTPSPWRAPQLRSDRPRSSGEVTRVVWRDGEVLGDVEWSGGRGGRMVRWSDGRGRGVALVLALPALVGSPGMLCSG